MIRFSHFTQSTNPLICFEQLKALEKVTQKFWAVLPYHKPQNQVQAGDSVGLFLLGAANAQFV